MELLTEYQISRYQDLGPLCEKKSVRLVRNQENGRICVKKEVPLEKKEIYLFLKAHPGPYIPQIYECFETEESLVVFEEYLSGQTLQELTEDHCFSEEKAVWILQELCCALKQLHHARPQIICRDLKAENVMLTAEGQVKLVDFHIARTYRDGLKKDTCLMGTAEYAAPEQYGYRQSDHRTDIFALGILLNYLLTGEFPTEKKAEGRIAEVIDRCTQMDPEKRYQSTEELEQALENFRQNKKTGNTNRGEAGGSFALPGFQTDCLWRKLLAAAGYLMLAYLCFSLEIVRDGVPLQQKALYLERMAVWLAHMAFVLLAGNYRGWSSRNRMLRSTHRLVRMAGYALLYMGLLCVAVVVSLCLEAWLL